MFVISGFPRQQARCFSAGLSEVHEMLKGTCREFVEKELKPIAADLDKNETYPTEMVIANQFHSLEVISHNVIRLQKDFHD